MDQRKAPLKLDPGSAGLPAFWKFRDDAYYKGFKDIEVYQALDLEEPKRAVSNTIAAADQFQDKKQDPVTVVFRYSNGKPAVASRLVDGGEVLFISTSADKGSTRASAEATWTDWPLHFEFVPFVDVMISHLLQGQTQTYNLVAGSRLDWQPALVDSDDRAVGEWIYTLVCPDGKNIRLGLAERRNNRSVVTASDLSLAGVYKMVATRRLENQPEEADSQPPQEAGALTGAPIAVTPDLRESQDLTMLTSDEVDQRLGFQPIHLTAGVEGSLQGTDERLRREWTTRLLAAVLVLALAEALLAYWCGRAR
jgi:hypothetical protein